MNDMDSVFANCTDKELAFDVMFDSDDTLIDIVAGVNEAGDLVTGEMVFREEAELLSNPEDKDYNEKDGDAAYDLKDAEGTKDEKLEVGGEVGDGKEVTGKENSAEASANDTKDEEKAIGANDAQQTSLECGDGCNTAGAPVECKEDDDVTVDAADDVADMDAATEEDPVDESFFAGLDSIVTKMVAESEAKLCPCCGQEFCDCAERNGLAKHNTDNIEGVKQDIVQDNIDGKSKEDPIEDPDDAASREGDPKTTDTDNVEGVKQDVVAASLESVKLVLGECEDAAAREGDPKTTDTKNVEGVKQDVVADNIDGKSKEDPIQDADDTAEREGEVKHDTSDVEGVKQDVVTANLESKILDDIKDDDSILDLILKDAETKDPVVPDDVNVNEAKDASDIDMADADVQIIEAADNEEEKDIIADVDEDDLIELVDSDSDEKKSDNVSVGYDDDELIDLVLSGKED